jgi:hypothetical protein
MQEQSTNGFQTNFKIMNFELNIIILFPKSFLLGVQYMEPEDGFEYEEINVFLGILQLQYRW